MTACQHQLGHLVWLQVDSVPTELVAHTKGPRISAVRCDRALMTWRMRQLRKSMLEVGWDVESLVEAQATFPNVEWALESAVQVRAGGVFHIELKKLRSHAQRRE